MGNRTLLLGSALICVAAQAQQPPQEDFTSWMKFDFSAYKPSFTKNHISGGCKIYIDSVDIFKNFDIRGDFRKYYFRELDKFQPQFKVALKTWLEQKGFEVVEKSLDSDGEVSLVISIVPTTPSNLMINGEAKYDKVDIVKANPNAYISFKKFGYDWRKAKSENTTGQYGVSVIEAFAKCDVKPPMPGFGLFSGKTYSGQELINNKAFIDAFGKVMEESITKCLDKIGHLKEYDSESIDDIVRYLKKSNKPVV